MLGPSASTIAALVLESIPVSAGIYVPPPEYVRGVRELCTKHCIIFIADEVMTGFGRTGKWFAVEHFVVVPDLMTFAKGVNSGYVPRGGVAITRKSPPRLASASTRGANLLRGPAPTAAAVATINAMETEGMVDPTARLGTDIIGPALASLAERHPSVGEVRGKGVFWAIELVKDRETREPLAPYGASSPEMNQLIAACKTRGLLPFANFKRIHLVPPCNTSVEDATAALAILDEVLDIADGFAA